MSQENCTQSKNYKHSRTVSIDILKKVKEHWENEPNNVPEFNSGYLRGIRFAIELLEEEWTSQKD